MVSNQEAPPSRPSFVEKTNRTDLNGAQDARYYNTLAITLRNIPIVFSLRSGSQFYSLTHIFRVISSSSQLVSRGIEQ